MYGFTFKNKMSYYDEVYLKRLNRFGNNFADRVQGQREADWEAYKKRSTYRVSFLDNEGFLIDGTLEPNKQDNSETTQWLLLDLKSVYNAGTIFLIDGKHSTNRWMILYLRETESKGYNKYLVLKLTHLIQWKDRSGAQHESWGYFYGKMDREIQDVIRSTYKTPSYLDPDKETHIIMPKTLDLRRQDYLVIDSEGYFVTGYDLNSTPGVGYFSLSETMLRDETLVDLTTDDSSDTFWLTGGKE